jgi:hypothetical protein
VSLLLIAPLGLAALVALALPLLLHIRRRTEEVPLDFAALRWLEALPKPRQRLRFDEWLLLALRLLLVAALALLLARPAVLGWEDDAPRVLAAPGVDVAAARAAAGPEAEIRWIEPGAPVSSTIRQFDAELPPGASLTILVPEVLAGVDAARLRLTNKVEWRVVKGAPGAVATPEPVAPALAVRHPAEDAGAVRYFRAATAAWSDSPRFEAAAGEALPPRGTVLVWLNPGPLPPAVSDWVSSGGTALLASTADLAMPAASAILWTDEAGRALVEGGPLGAGRVLRFTRPLVPAAMPDLLDARFAEGLRDLVSPPAPPPARVNAAIFAPTADVQPFPLPPRELSRWLAVLIAVLFLAERWLATRRRRFAA